MVAPDGKLRFSLRTLLLAVSIAAVVIGGLVWLARPRAFPRGRVVEVRVWFMGAKPGDPPAFTITDPAQIRKWFAEPLRNSHADRNPAAYVVLGWAELEYEDKSLDSFALFLPWGHWKHDADYFVGDFRPLQDGLRKLPSSLSARDRRVFELELGMP